MIRVLLLCGLVAVVLAIQKPCCLPQQFQTRDEFHGADCEHDTITTANVREYYDYPNQRYRVDFADVEATELFFYQTKTGYYIRNGSCTKFNITGSLPRICIPVFYNVTDRYILGYNSSIKAVDFSFITQTLSNTFTVTDSCIPLFARSYITTETLQGGSSVVFKDVVPAILNSTVFDIPTICPKEEMNDLLYFPKKMPMLLRMLTDVEFNKMLPS